MITATNAPLDFSQFPIVHDTLAGKPDTFKGRSKPLSFATTILLSRRPAPSGILDGKAHDRTQLRKAVRHHGDDCVVAQAHHR
jgi:hypothetical protein